MNSGHITFQTALYWE